MKYLLLALAACQFPAPAAPQFAEDSTFKMLAGTSIGTAWAVSEHHLITAGHMCSATDKYALVSRAGERFAAELVDYADDYPELLTNPGPMSDICLIHTDRTLSVHLTLADKLPAIGQQVFYVGYPRGEWTKSFGRYQGDVDGPSNHWSDYSFSAPCDHGASGSAVLSSSGVWGVLVRIKVIGGELHDGAEGCAATPLHEIRDLLRRNGL